jgi:hypothetical protein
VLQPRTHASFPHPQSHHHRVCVPCQPCNVCRMLECGRRRAWLTAATVTHAQRVVPVCTSSSRTPSPPRLRGTTAHNTQHKRKTRRQGAHYEALSFAHDTPLSHSCGQSITPSHTILMHKVLPLSLVCADAHLVIPCARYCRTRKKRPRDLLESKPPPLLLRMILSLIGWVWVLGGCDMGIGWVLQGHCRGIAGVLQGYCRGIAGVLHKVLSAKFFLFVVLAKLEKNIRDDPCFDSVPPTIAPPVDAVTRCALVAPSRACACQ